MVLSRFAIGVFFISDRFIRSTFSFLSQTCFSQSKRIRRQSQFSKRSCTTYATYVLVNIHNIKNDWICLLMACIQISRWNDIKFMHYDHFLKASDMLHIFNIASVHPTRKNTCLYLIIESIILLTFYIFMMWETLKCCLKRNRVLTSLNSQKI